MPDNPKPVDPVISPKTKRDHRDPSGFNEHDYPDNAADQIVPESDTVRGGHDRSDEVSGFDDRKPSEGRSDVNSPSDIHKY